MDVGKFIHATYANMAAVARENGAVITSLPVDGIAVVIDGHNAMLAFSARAGAGA
jgi:hypothetical protein